MGCFLVFAYFCYELLLYKSQAFGGAVVGGGYRYAGGYAFCRAVEQARRVARNACVYRKVGLAKFGGGFRFVVAAAFAFLIGRAARAARYGYVLCTAAVAVVVLAIFLSAFKIVHV